MSRSIGVVVVATTLGTVLIGFLHTFAPFHLQMANASGDGSGDQVNHNITLVASGWMDYLKEQLSVESSPEDVHALLDDTCWMSGKEDLFGGTGRYALLFRVDDYIVLSVEFSKDGRISEASVGRTIDGKGWVKYPNPNPKGYFKYSPYEPLHNFVFIKQ